jgi:hypothetical protein
MHHPKSAFTKVKDAASMALKVLVDQAVDDEAFWGALTNDTTHPVVRVKVVSIVRGLILLAGVSAATAHRSGG